MKSSLIKAPFDPITDISAEKWRRINECIRQRITDENFYNFYGTNPTEEDIESRCFNTSNSLFHSAIDKNHWLALISNMPHIRKPLLIKRGPLRFGTMQ
ncbi:hypothetical protein GJ496_005665 [Pomphorhynchus laevis]|nr:hypothetical protein GJ496_005665 [Pomphorhynchus laevis]